MPCETLDQIVVTSAAGDRSEIPFAALVVEDLEGQFGLVDRTSVVSEPAHDAGIDLDPVGTVALGRHQFRNGFQFLNARGPDLGPFY